MKINKAYKFRIYPNKIQCEILEKHFGCARFIYNYFLRQRIDFYENNQSSEKKSLTYHDNALAATQLKNNPDYEWLKEVNSQSLQMSLKYLDAAYRNFFNRKAKFPSFKKKHNRQSFCVPQHFSLKGNVLNIPKCPGIRIVLHRQIVGVMRSVTISKTPSGKYFASLLCELDIPEPVFAGNQIGLHYGIKSFITDSSGISVESPKHLGKSEKRLKRLQRRLSCKQKESKSRRKAGKRFARLHEKIANRRRDFLNKTSKQLVSDNQAIYIENLAVSDMAKNHLIAKSILDSGWNMFVNMLKYKGKWYGCRIIEIDRYFPSSKRCHVCGYINESLTFKDRSWQCPECNTNNDRELNAAINILTFGRTGTVQTILPSLDGTRTQVENVLDSLKPETPSESSIQDECPRS